MKCKQCYTEVKDGVTQCPVCGAKIVDSLAEIKRAQEQKRALHPQKSRLATLFIAWITCGLFTWKYLGDDIKHRDRMDEFKRQLIGALFIVGIFSYFITIVKWWISDMYGIITGTMCYSDGTEVW